MVKEIDFSSSKLPVLGMKTGHSRVSSSCRTHLSCQRSAPFVEIDHRQHGEGPVGVLGETAITHLGKTPETFERQEGMLDLGTDTGLAAVRCFVNSLKRTPVPEELLSMLARIRESQVAPDHAAAVL